MKQGKNEFKYVVSAEQINALWDTNLMYTAPDDMGRSKIEFIHNYYKKSLEQSAKEYNYRIKGEPEIKTWFNEEDNNYSIEGSVELEPMYIRALIYKQFEEAAILVRREAKKIKLVENETEKFNQFEELNDIIRCATNMFEKLTAIKQDEIS